MGYHCRRRQPVALPGLPVAGTDCVAHGHRTLLRGCPAVSRTLTVDRQLVLLAGQEPRHGPPKTRASYRVLPLPQVVLEALAEHLREFPVRDNGLVFTTNVRASLNRTRFP